MLVRHQTKGVVYAVILSRQGIMEELGRGVYIYPFNPDQVNTSSYDVRVAPWFYRQDDMRQFQAFMFNPYSQAMVKRYYGEPQIAPMAKDVPHYAQDADFWENILPWHRVIVIQPGEMILGCTVEFIGGTRNSETGECYTTEMRARSSVGRVGLEVCRCAGWGDDGYVNRWTLEIVSTGKLPIPLVVANLPEDADLKSYDGPRVELTGTRLAQIIFHQTTNVDPADLYGSDGRSHYQIGTEIGDIIERWNPSMLLPKLTSD